MECLTQSVEDKSWKTVVANNVACKTYSALHGAGILRGEQSLAEICVYVQVARMTETLPICCKVLSSLKVIYFYKKYFILNIVMVAMPS